MKEATFAPSSVRWPADLKAQLERRAEADGRTFSNYVIQALRKHVESTRPSLSVSLRKRERSSATYKVTVSIVT